MTYAEYLKSQGATDDEIKALTEGSFAKAAERAFNKLQADIEAKEAARVAAAKLADDTKKEWEEFYAGPVADKFREANSLAVSAQAREAAARTALLKAQELGLLNVAKDLGYKIDEPANGGGNAPANGGNAPANGAPVNRDTYTKDEINQLADRYGEGTALVADLAAEHAMLFPNASVNWRQIRKEAMAAKLGLEQYWEQKFKVPEARAERARLADEARIAKLVDERYKVRETELISKYGNPDTRPLAASTNPVTARVFRTKPGDENALPWKRAETMSDDAMREARVKRVVEKQFAGGGTTH